MKRMKFFPILLILLVLLMSGATIHAQGKPYDGVSFNLLTFTGPQIAEPLQRRAPDFEALTGAKVSVIIVPFNSLYSSILTDQATGTNSYQAFVFDPQWMADFVTPGYLEDLTPYVQKDKDLQWDDVGQFFRTFSATFNGNIYTIPLDGDFHMVYYRTDVLKKLNMDPPKTWDDYLAIAKAANGTDMNGDGVGDFGSCISKKKGAQAYWFITSVAASFIQAQGTSQGAFFDTSTFVPLVNNPGFIKALDIYGETTKYGPPDELTDDVGPTRSLFTSGRCALSMDWGDIGPLSVASDSKVNGLTGAVITPGSKEVLDRSTNQLVPCDAKTCPYATDGVNHAPYASFGGWSGAVSAAADPKVKEAAYAFLSYMSQPAQANVDVTIGKTGFNPYRTSQFTDLKPWLAAGFSEDSAKNYLGAIESSLNSPNMVLDLRIPQNQRYQQVVEDDVVSRFLAGEMSSADAAKQISDGWEAITNELGRDTQKAAYLASLGIKGGG
jgi:multiple sugar transport system substrate-binding protein